MKRELEKQPNRVDVLKEIRPGEAPIGEEVGKPEESVPVKEAQPGSMLQESPTGCLEERALGKKAGDVPRPCRIWTILYPLRYLGPGVVGGLSGNDPSAVTAYALDGAQAGFGHLWLLVFATAMYQAVLYACAKIGRVTQCSFTETLRIHYSPAVTYSATLVLLFTNVALISADLVAIGAGVNLLFGLDYHLVLLPIAGTLWGLTVFGTFRLFKTTLLVLSLTFAAYLLTAFLERPQWSVVLVNTLWPHLNGSFASLSSAVALLGATISPYTMFWQVQSEREVHRPGTLYQQFRLMAWDMGTGVLLGNLVAYFIILSSSLALFSAQGTTQPGGQTAIDVTRSLSPIVGPYASILFALGLVGAGLVAVPILLVSTSDAVAGAFGWPTGLFRKRWETGGFSVILSVALFVSLALALAAINPLQLLFWANVFSGGLAPILVGYVLLVGNSRRIMGHSRLGWLTNSWLIVTILVMVGAAALMLFSLLTGSGGV